MQQLEGKTAREAVDQGIAEADVEKLSRIAKLIGEPVKKASKKCCSMENFLHLCTLNRTLVRQHSGQAASEPSDSWRYHHLKFTDSGVCFSARF